MFYYICIYRDVYHNYVYICPKIVQEKKTVTDICRKREKKREKERERYVLTEAKALPSASPVCELPVGVPRFVTAKKKQKTLWEAL